MAYFANGAEGMDYEAQWCQRCIHFHPLHGCPCLNAHMLWNYEECNKPDSILHRMIPRENVPTKFGPFKVNGQCIFFNDEGKDDELMKRIREQCFHNNG